MTTDGSLDYSVILYTRTVIEDLGLYLGRRQLSLDVYPKLCARYGTEGILKAIDPFAELLTSVARDVKSYQDFLDYLSTVFVSIDGNSEQAFANTTFDNPAQEYVSKAFKALTSMYEDRNNRVKEFLRSIDCHSLYYPTINDNLKLLTTILERNNKKDMDALIGILELSKRNDRGYGRTTQQAIFHLTQVNQDMQTVFSRFRKLMLESLGYMETFEALCARATEK